MPAAKKKRNKKKASDIPAAFEIFARLGSEDYRPVRRAALVALLVSVVGAGCVWGLYSLRSHVHRLTHFERVELWIDWEDVPPFLQADSYDSVFRGLESAIALTANDRVLDDSLAQRIAGTLSQTGPRSVDDIAWIKKVNRVIVRPNGRISVNCTFRYPRAFVSWGEYFYRVDDEGIRLPGQYRVSQWSPPVGILIRGVEAPEPVVGHYWPGEDLQTGLELTRMLLRQPYRDQVASINVENYQGRITQTQPHLVIATDRPGSRIWWGRAPHEEMGVENSAGQKLALLRRLYDHYGRIDINRPFVDIRSFSDSIQTAGPNYAAGTH